MKGKLFKALIILLSATLLCGTFACAKKGTDESRLPPTQGDTEQGEGGGENELPSGSEEGGELTYSQRMERNLTGVEKTSFTQYLTNLEPYPATSEISLNAIYAAPNGSGEGTFADPYSLQDALDEVKAGQTIYLMGGTYSAPDADGYFINKKGAEGKYITIRPYLADSVKITNANSGKESYALQIDPKVQYVIIEGLEICSVQAICAYGIAVWGDGQSHIIIRNCNIHDIKTTTKNPETDEEAGANAILLVGEKSAAIADFAIVDNFCHDNVTGWSETVSVTSNCERVYVVGNKVKDNTNIGIVFNGNVGYNKNKALDQPRFCLAADNEVSGSVCGYAECAGLYVDGARDVILQYNTVTGSQFGIEIGSEERQDDYPVKNIVARYNTCRDNIITGLRIGGYEEEATGVVKNVRIYSNTIISNCTSAEGAEVVLAKCDGIAFEDNIICSAAGRTLVRTEFSAAYCKNITFTNNIFYSEGAQAADAKFGLFGEDCTGIEAFNALFAATNSYKKPEAD